MGVLGKRKAPWTIEQLAKNMAFWHGQRISHDGRTVAYWNGGGEFADAPERYTQASRRSALVLAWPLVITLLQRKWSCAILGNGDHAVSPDTRKGANRWLMNF